MNEEAGALTPELEVPLGPRVGMFMSPKDMQLHPEKLIRFDGPGEYEQYYMPLDRWENMGRPTKIEVRLEAAGFGDV